MPQLSYYKCSICNFELEEGSWGSPYVIDYEGERKYIGHPLEESYIERALGMPPDILAMGIRIRMAGKLKRGWSKRKKEEYDKKIKLIELSNVAWSFARTRMGNLSSCLCLDCLEKQKLDLERDEKQCSRCSSANIKSTKELLATVCPKCKKGVIEEIKLEVWT